MEEYICEACGQPCQPIVVDFGIGAYEYWGARGNHRDEHEVSNCCEAELLDAKEVAARRQEKEDEKIADLLESLIDD